MLLELSDAPTLWCSDALRLKWKTQMEHSVHLSVLASWQCARPTVWTWFRLIKLAGLSGSIVASCSAKLSLFGWRRGWWRLTNCRRRIRAVCLSVCLSVCLLAWELFGLKTLKAISSESYLSPRKQLRLPAKRQPRQKFSHRQPANQQASERAAVTFIHPNLLAPMKHNEPIHSSNASVYFHSMHRNTLVHCCCGQSLRNDKSCRLSCRERSLEP